MRFTRRFYACHAEHERNTTIRCARGKFRLFSHPQICCGSGHCNFVLHLRGFDFPIGHDCRFLAQEPACFQFCKAFPNLFGLGISRYETCVRRLARESASTCGRVTTIALSREAITLQYLNSVGQSVITAMQFVLSRSPGVHTKTSIGQMGVGAGTVPTLTLLRSARLCPGVSAEDIHSLIRNRIV
jgi:hypothetical protein